MLQLERLWALIPYLGLTLCQIPCSAFASIPDCKAGVWLRSLQQEVTTAD